MDHKELLETMGFVYEQKTYAAEDEDGQTHISTMHTLTHPDVPGLFLAHKDFKKMITPAITVIKTLVVLNELKVREIKTNG